MKYTCTRCNGMGFVPAIAPESNDFKDCGKCLGTGLFQDAYPPDNPPLLREVLKPLERKKDLAKMDRVALIESQFRR